MEILVRTVLIVLGVAVAATSFLDLGKKPIHSRAEYLAFATFVYVVLGLGIVLWWPTPDVGSAIGKGLVLISFMLDWVPAVLLVHTPTVVKTRPWALAGCAYGLLWVGCGVFLWPA